MFGLSLLPPFLPKRSPRIHPVFLPYQGCPGRCVFCAQPTQTGQNPQGLDQALEDLKRTLEALAALGGPPLELAFYGGTFTLLPPPWPERFLEAAGPYLAQGRLTGLRCSTRPDAVTPKILRRLKDLGLGLVELGVQSFDDAALAVSGRGGGRSQTLEGCAAVRQSGLKLGIQLMPGLPGDRDSLFEEDLALALAQDIAALRLYPCLVIEGTPLAEIWRQGRYAPWPLEATVRRLARASLASWAAGVPVIRTGLAPQPGLAEKILAGPVHPALGQMVRSRALFEYLRDALPPGLVMAGLDAPRAVQGDFWGQAGALKPEYAALGLAPNRVRFGDRPDFVLDCAPVVPA